MTVHQLEYRIREFISSGRRQFALLKDPAAWNKLCSSLDLIGDTQLAIEAYPQFHDAKGYGASYLIVYGILQTLLLQQDAAKHIGDALNIKVKLPRALKDIRIIRNSAAGHPGYQKEKGLSKSCFITRMSISPTSFQLMIAYSGDKEYDTHNVNITSLVETQQTYICELLKKVIAEMENQEMEHRAKHKNKILADIFPHTMSYHMGKIMESTHSSRQFSFGIGIANLKMITGYIENFKKALVARDDWGVYDSINFHYELIRYPIMCLDKYFNNNNDMNEKDAYIFASFISEQLKLFETFARELDEEYESNL